MPPSEHELRLRQRLSRLRNMPLLGGAKLSGELDRLQRDWRVFTPRPGFYDEVGLKYRKAMGTDQAVVLVAIMLVSVTFYVWFINRGRRSRDVSML